MFRLAGLSDPDARADACSRARDSHRQSTDLPRRQRRHPQSQQPLAPRRLLRQSPRPRLARVLPRRRPRQADHLHRLATHRHHRRSRPRRLPTHRRLEGSPRLSPHRRLRLLPPPKPSPTSASPSSAPRSPEPPSSAHATFRGAVLVSATLGDAVGQLYVKRFFSPEAKAQAEAIVANLIAAFRVRLENITWMAPATKKEAITKLGTLQVGIGYPDHWRSYAAYEVTPDNLFANLWNASLFEYHYSLSRIGKPVDRKEWCMTPQTVNAVNLPLDNGLNFPAAILQPPFFDPKAPAAHNYGAIGTVIGHEISHTFDSEGAAFDSMGRVRNWWTPEDLAHFNTVTSSPRRAVRHLRTVPRRPRQRPPDPRRSHRRRSRSRRRVRRLSRITQRQSSPQSTPTSPATSSSSSPSPRTGAPSSATPPSASRSSPTPTHPASTAPSPSATTTPGTPPSTSNPPTNSIWPPKTASASGESAI